MKKYIVLGCIGILGCAIRLVSEQVTKESISLKDLVTAIEKLIKENAIFSVNLTHPLLPGKIKQWQRTELLKIPTQIQWNTFINDVHAFNAYLHALLNKNPQTETYYHLENLQKDAKLYQSLIKLEKSLAKYMTQLEETSSPFKLSKKSLPSLQYIINLYATFFYQNKLLAHMETFFKQFEEEAKELRTNEEKITNQAALSQTNAYQLGLFPRTSLDDDFEIDTMDFDPSFDFSNEIYEPDDLDDFDFSSFSSSFFE